MKLNLLLDTNYNITDNVEAFVNANASEISTTTSIVLVILVVLVIFAIVLSQKAKTLPTWTANAKIIDKHYSKQSGYSLTFEFEDGDRKSIGAHEEDYKKFVIGDSGTLVYNKFQTAYFLKSFTLDAADKQPPSDSQ